MRLPYLLDATTDPNTHHQLMIYLANIEYVTGIEQYAERKKF